MKKFLPIYVIITLLSCAQISFADAKFQLEQVNNAESLPRIELKETLTSQKEFKPLPIKTQEAPKQLKPAFNPKKNSGLTNYQYDDQYYKYNKYEKFIKDNIEYSKSGSTKLY